MRKSKFSESQIVGAIKRAESGVPVKDICRVLGVSPAAFYQWRSKYSGREASDLKRLKELKEDNRRLKHMYAGLALDHEVLEDIVVKSSERRRPTGAGAVCPG